MSRVRELYMDITVAGRNFERKDEILTLKPENTIEILDAYFAKRNVKVQYKTYIVAKNESLSKIATSNNTTIEIIKKDNNLTTNTIPVN